MINLEYRTLEDIKENKKEIMIWQIVGAIVIFGVGALWHFMYEWIEIPALGWFFPVNESVWEHVKLMFWPALIYYTIEGIFLWKKTNNYILAKMYVFYFTPAVNIIFFYTYTGATGYENFIIDSIVLLIVTCIQQYISYKLLTREQIFSERPITLIALSATGIFILGFILILFTYYPPHIPLFQDSLSGEYGIITT